MARKGKLTEKNAALDSIDRQILRALHTDGRASFRDLSKSVYLSPNATAERVRRLQSMGVIRGFHARLDPASLGLYLEAYIDVKLQPGTSAQSFEAAVRKLSGVVSMAILTGAFDVRLRVVCGDQTALGQLIETLRARTGALETNSTVICREVEVWNWSL
jgi:Lrp/AsnC family transcriptional regulator, leucine-responsive regulatory protein